MVDGFVRVLLIGVVVFLGWLGCGLLICFDLELWLGLIVLMFSVWYWFCWYFDGLVFD